MLKFNLKRTEILEVLAKDEDEAMDKINEGSDVEFIHEHEVLELADKVRTTGEIEQEIKSLVKEYGERTKIEIEGSTDKVLNRRLLNATSEWSGGFSVSNMLEQIVRHEIVNKLNTIWG